LGSGNKIGCLLNGNVDLFQLRRRMPKKRVSRKKFDWVDRLLDVAERKEALTVEWSPTSESDVLHFGTKEARFIASLALNGTEDQLWESFRRVCAYEELASAQAAKVVLMAIFQGGPIQVDETIKRLKRIRALSDRLRYEVLRHFRFAEDTPWDFLQWEDHLRVFGEFSGRAPDEREVLRMQKMHSLLKAFPLTIPELLKRLADKAEDDVLRFKTRKVVKSDRPNAQMLQFRGYMCELLLGKFPQASLVPLARIVTAITTAAYPAATIGEETTLKELVRLRNSDNAIVKEMHQRKKGTDKK